MGPSCWEGEGRGANHLAKEEELTRTKDKKTDFERNEGPIHLKDQRF